MNFISFVVIQAGGDVSSMGTNAQSVQNMNAALYGSNMSANNFLQGTAQGVGATNAKANGSAIMVNGSQTSPTSKISLGLFSNGLFR